VVGWGRSYVHWLYLHFLQNSSFIISSNAIRSLSNSLLVTESSTCTPSYFCSNLFNWARENADLFAADYPDDMPADVIAYRVAKGIARAKSRVRMGKPCPTHKGWRVIAWDDHKNCEKRQDPPAK